MANLLTRKQIGELIGKDATYVGMYIKRNKILEQNKKIDTDHPINRAFVAKFLTKSEVTKKVKSIKTKPSTETDYKTGVSEKENAVYLESEIRQLDLKAKQSRFELDQLELARKKAKVMPIDFATDMFNLYLRSNVNMLKDNAYKLLEQAIDELNGGYEMKLKYKKALNIMITETVNSNHTRLSDEIMEKAKDYSTQRNW